MTINGDTYCGLYCGACSIARYAETERDDGFTACIASIPKSELVCGGCKSDTVYAGCRTCSFRDCAVSKGVSHCNECSEYPCKDYRKWESVKRLLPHLCEAAGNLEAIRRDGVEAWIAGQQKRWSCRRCGAPLSWYSVTCSKCGHELTGKAYTMAGIRKLVCSLLLPRVYKKGKELSLRQALGTEIPKRH